MATFGSPPDVGLTLGAHRVLPLSALRMASLVGTLLNLASGYALRSGAVIVHRHVDTYTSKGAICHIALKRY